MPRSKHPNILIIANQKEIDLLAEALSSDFSLITSHHPKEALELLKIHRFQAIIASFALPQMSGMMFFQNLLTRKKFAKIPLILILDHENHHMVELAFKEGLTHFIHLYSHCFAVKTTVQSAIHHNHLYQQLRRKANKLQKKAERDPLTKFYNRYMLYVQGKREVNKAQRGNLPLSVLMIDIDGFKFINDTLGHLVGDEVLMEFSDLLASTLRSIDVTARFGGEEFVVLLPQTDSDQALVVAEKIRAAVEGYQFCTSVGVATLTVSIGVATLSKTSKKLEHLLENIDEALYKAKGTGRNRVVLFEI